MRIATFLGALAITAAVNGYPMPPAVEPSTPHLAARQINNFSNIIQGVTGLINAFRTIGSAFGGINKTPQLPVGTAPPLGVTPQLPPSGTTPQLPPFGATPQLPPSGATPQLPPLGATPQLPSLGANPQLPPQTLPVGNPITSNTSPGPIKL